MKCIFAKNASIELSMVKNVHAVFYFKNGNNLDVWSDKGIYNNKNLDMEFQNNVKAKYQGTDLFAEGQQEKTRDS